MWRLAIRAETRFPLAAPFLLRKLVRDKRTRPQYEVRKVRNLTNDYTSYEALLSSSNVHLVTKSDVFNINDIGIPPIFQ